MHANRLETHTNENAATYTALGIPESHVRDFENTCALKGYKPSVSFPLIPHASLGHWLLSKALFSLTAPPA